CGLAPPRPGDGGGGDPLGDRHLRRRPPHPLRLTRPASRGGPARLQLSSDAAASSRRYVVDSMPTAPATGQSEGAAPPRPCATASALPSPAATTSTWRERRTAGSVNVSRSGGGLGQSRTPTTSSPVSSTAGECGKIESMCPSG